MSDRTGPLERERATKLPGWAAGILGAIIVSAVATGAAAVVDTRSSLAVLTTKVDALEGERSANAGVPAQLAVLTTKVDALTAQLAALTSKLDDPQPRRPR